MDNTATVLARPGKRPPLKRSSPAVAMTSNLFETLANAIADHQHARQMATSNAVIRDAADIGRAIKVRRRSLKLSQSALANAAGVGRRFVSEFENGKETASLREAIKVCDVLGLKLAIFNEDRPAG